MGFELDYRFDWHIYREKVLEEKVKLEKERKEAATLKAKGVKKAPNKREQQLLIQKALYDQQQAEIAKAKELKKQKKIAAAEDEKNIVKSVKEILTIEKEIRDKKINEKISAICKSVESSAVPKRMREGYVTPDEFSDPESSNESESEEKQAE